MHPIAPQTLVDLWNEKHPHKADTQTALASLPTLIANLPTTQGAPTLVHMLGLPGSGKTTLVESLLQHTPLGQKFYRHDADRVLDAIPAYHQTHRQEGALAAFKRWETPAYVAHYALMDELLKRRLSFFFDHGASDINHFGLMLHARQQGYKVAFLHTHVPTDMALERVRDRNTRGGRAIPETMVTERNTKLEHLIPEYAQQIPIIPVDTTHPLTPETLQTLHQTILNL